ncbi:hypothetical protein CDD81_866 [Ophiocordyceps australis]|uniref:Alpha/beta hydrolase fold-3 domain-containing protein n=1 Tax=Ophiocordyceps australis TaxID=1399860 RepID=A0A2C5XKT2_9HYPO|nr:hypothetical protein CDD81_866 [Ophiocordyceps australis]
MWKRVRAKAMVRRRAMSTGKVGFERIFVKCGSGSQVMVELHNAPARQAELPLVVVVPGGPYTRDSDIKAPQWTSGAQLPGFLSQWPCAIINYQWERIRAGNCYSWPGPVHQVTFAYEWLVKHLAPGDCQRRDIYVYASGLGAGLGAGLALTQAHSHGGFGIRGLVCLSGIYNWTMFLPDHGINRLAPTGLEEEPHIGRMRSIMHMLFGKPADLFDPFASPSLFLHSPSFEVPDTFTMTQQESLLRGLEARRGTTRVLSEPRQSRVSHLIFPPRDSTLKLPRTKLLTYRSQQRHQGNRHPHTLLRQAEEMRDLMRFSVAAEETKARDVWDQEGDNSEAAALAQAEAKRRVQVGQVNSHDTIVDMDQESGNEVLEWIQSGS